MRLQRAALRPLSFPTALSVSHHHMRLYGKTGSGGSSIASGRRLHAEEDGDAGDHGDGDGSQADGEAEQGDDAVTLGEDRKSPRLNSSHYCASRMPSSAGKKKNQK